MSLDAAYGRATATVGAGLLARGAGTVVITVAAFAATSIAVVSLGPARYGVVAFGLAITTVVAVGARLGIGSAVIRAVARAIESRRPAEVDAVGRAAWTLVTATGIAGGVVVAAFTWSASGSQPHAGGPVLALGLGALLLGTNVAAAGTFVARGAGRMLRAEVPQLALVGAQLAGMLGVAMRPSLGAAGVAFAVAGIAGGTAGAIVLRSVVPARRLAIELARGRSLASDAAPYAVVDLGTQLIAQFDVIVLGLVASATIVGSYDPTLRAADRTLLLIPALFLAGFVPAASALVRRGDRQALAALYATTSKLSFILAAGPMVVIAAFPEPLLHGLFGERIEVDPVTVRILVAGYAAHLAFGLNTGVLIAAVEGRRIVSAYLPAFVTMLALAAVLIPPFDDRGAAAATALAYLVMNVGVSRRVEAATGVRPFHRDHLVVVATAILPLTIAILAARRVDDASIPLALGLSIVVWSAWILLLRAVRVISIPEVRNLGPRRGRRT